MRRGSTRSRRRSSSSGARRGGSRSSMPISCRSPPGTGSPCSPARIDPSRLGAARFLRCFGLYAFGRNAVNKEVYDKGLANRREVLGAEYVDNAIKNADDFNRPLQEFVTEYCWGAIWGRPGLPKKTRSMLNLAMLSILNRPHEFKLHVKGALKNGVTREEIIEILLQVGCYAGVPVAVDAFRNAREAFKEMGCGD